MVLRSGMDPAAAVAPFLNAPIGECREDRFTLSRCVRAVEGFVVRWSLRECVPVQDAVANGKSMSQFLAEEKEESWRKKDVTMS